MDRISLIQLESELGAGTRGASLGPAAVLIEDYKDKGWLHKLSGERLPNTFKELVGDNGYAKAKRIEEIIGHSGNISKAVYECLRVGNFPIIFSGDHSNAYGSICGHKKFLEEQKLGVIWIDAHADLHTPYTTPSGNMHGMPLGMALAEDLDKNGEDYSASWKKLVGLNEKTGKISANDIAFIAVRETEEAEEKIMRENSIQNIRVEEVRNMGIAETIQKTLDKLSHCDSIYISFDVDSMDPDLVSRGTGTPVPGGLSLEEAIAINEGLARDEKIIGWEMTEVNPLLDKENLMARSALQVVYAVLESLNAKG